MKIKDILSLSAIVFITTFGSAQWHEPADTTPAYFAKVPSSPQHAGQILKGAQLSGPYFTRAYQIGAYKNALKVADLLYLMPCYCRCDRAEGHKSLHRGFEGTHGATCSTCLLEVTYVYQMARKGWPATRIREGIEKGEWEHIDLEQVYPEAAGHPR